MQNRGLLFIPDISGFSRFVSQTEIEHSRLIIQELLEILINANSIGLEISEIEGDAILFYKFGDPPALEELYRQVEQMFCAFHKNLIAYERRRYCQCQACMSAVGLTLKVITHYGEFTEYNVSSFNKLIGKDLIVAHQLLKNDIDQHEYWLVTETLLQNDQPERIARWMKWYSSAKHTENGEVVFQYTQLGELKNQLAPDPIPQLELSGQAKVISVQQEYQTDIITLFHATGDFSYRIRWLEGIKKIDEVGHFLPRVGMKCRCVMDNGKEVVISASSYKFQENRVEFSETNETKEFLSYYTLEKTGEKRTKLTIDFYIRKGFPSAIIFDLLKRRKMEKILRKSMNNLIHLVTQIKIPKGADC